MKQCKKCNVIKHNSLFGHYRCQVSDVKKIRNVCKRCLANKAKITRTFKINKDDFKPGEYDPAEHWFEDDPRALKENDVGKVPHIQTHLPRAWIDNA